MDEQEKRELLARNALFADFEAEQVDGLQALAEVRRRKSAEAVFRQGEPGNDMYIVVDGKVRVSIVLRDGKELSVGTLGKGDGFGEISLFDTEGRTATVTATEPSTFLVIRNAPLMDFLRANPDAAIKLLGVLARRLRSTDELIKDTLFVSLPARLAKKLLGLAHAYGQHTRAGIRLSVPFSEADLAEMTGLSQQSISAQLRAWSEQSLIRYHDDTLTILNPDELALLV